jgi:hypothetical protein
MIRRFLKRAFCERVMRCEDKLECDFRRGGSDEEKRAEHKKARAEARAVGRGRSIDQS